MSAKAIYEAKGKELLNANLGGTAAKNLYVSVDAKTNWASLPIEHPWLNDKVFNVIARDVFVCILCNSVVGFAKDCINNQ